MQTNIESTTDNSQWSSLWAMDRTALNNVFAGVPPTAPKQAAKPQTYAVQGTVAIIPIVGPISKYPTLVGAICGEVSTLVIQSNIAKALADDSIASIVLYIDSPGGSVDGTPDLANYISQAKSQKPITAFISDNCLSGAYWLASQCTYIVANESAFVGCIGVFAVIKDVSQAAAKAGITMHLVSSGGVKGATTPGLPIDDDALSDVQNKVDKTNELFINAISEGRKMQVSEVVNLADGRTHIAADAKALNLIDDIGSLDIAINIGTNDMEKKTKASAEAAPATDAPADTSAPDISGVLKQIQETLATLVESIKGITDSDESTDQDGGVDNADGDGGDTDAKAVAKDHDRLKAISAAVGNRHEFALKAYLAGQSPTEAKASLVDVLLEENGKLQKTNSRNGVEPLAISAPAIVNAADPEALWASNADGVQEKYSGRKDYFLNALKHKTAKNKRNK